jgi:5'-nucleotidase/UDP-sugar diphosphatase
MKFLKQKKFGAWGLTAKRLIAAVLLAGLAAGSLFAGARKEQDTTVYELVLLHTNDHHGSTLANNGRGGLAERSTFISTVRAENRDVLLLDAGDINTGSALSNMFGAEPDILAYNIMGYDAAVFGNHEFDSTQAKLDAQIALAAFPFLCANIKTADGGYLGGHPYLIKRYRGFTVGIFGLTTLRTRVIASPDADLVFLDEIASAQEMVETLRREEKVDIVIALTHMGNVKEDPSHITTPELAAAVSGIDVIVDGHSHSFFEEALVVNNTSIVSANEWGKYVGYGRLRISRGRLLGFDWEPVEINTADSTAYLPDPTITALLSPYEEKAAASLREVIGTAGETFIFGNRLTRYGETALGNMICDSNVWYFRTLYNQDIDFAIQNGGNIRTELPAGPITREQILTILPFENYLFIVSMKGSQILELFQFIATIPQGAGGFSQVSSAVRYTIDYTGGAGVLQDLTIYGAPIDPEKSYRFCTNDYLLSGGDGYTVLTEAMDPFNTSLLLSYVVTEYIKAQGTIRPATDGRLTVIGGARP